MSKLLLLSRILSSLQRGRLRTQFNGDPGAGGEAIRKSTTILLGNKMEDWEQISLEDVFFFFFAFKALMRRSWYLIIQIAKLELIILLESN